MDIKAVSNVENELLDLFIQLSALQSQIRQQLAIYSDGKNLKGNELVGWIGEIYGKLLLHGKLVDDKYEHDIETQGGCRISVKTRKGEGSSWRQTSAIPKIEGGDCPTHLLFVHLNDDYSLDRMWLFDWIYLKNTDRFKKHNVRGNLRSYIFILNELIDKDFVVYSSKV